jgi:hypothetical protein
MHVEPSGSYPEAPKTGREGDLFLVLFRGLAQTSPIRCLSDWSPGKRTLRVCINKHDPQAQYIHIHAYIEVTSKSYAKELSPSEHKHYKNISHNDTESILYNQPNSYLLRAVT